LGNINLSNEPIKLEWDQGCVTGFDGCDFSGSSKNICATGTFTYTLLPGTVLPDGPAVEYPYVRSFKIPKGFKLYYKGGFNKKIMLKYTSENNLKDLPAVSSLKESTVTGPQNEYCATNRNPYWRYSVSISTTSYIQILILIPNFLKSLIRAKGSRFQMDTFSTQYDTCTTTYNKSQVEVTSLKTQITTLQTTKAQTESTITVLTTRKKYYEGLVSGTIKAEDWAEQAKKYIGQIKDLRDKIAQLETEIAALLVQLNNLNKSINDLNSQKNTITVTVTSLNNQKSNTITTLNADLATLKQIEVLQTNKISTYTAQYSLLQNMEKSRKNYEEQMRMLQEKLKELDGQIEKSTCDLATLEDEIDATMKRQKAQKVKVDNGNKIINDFTIQIEQSNQKFIQLSNDINNTNLKVYDINNQINIKRQQIHQYEGQISSWTVQAQQISVAYYQSQLTEVNTKITIETKTLTETTTTITTITSKVTTLLDIINVSQKCQTEAKSSVQTSLTTFNNDLKAVNDQMNAILGIYNDSSSNLTTVIGNINLNQSLNDYVSAAKRILHEYLDALPSDPSMGDFAIRRRRLRRRRRMI
jgi:predicted  nucleic acid-binding Zn-ribbon protein